MKRLATVLAVAFALAACSQSTTGGAAAPAPAPAAPAQPETIDPLGTYDYSTEVEGQSFSGTMSIAGTRGTYTGSITSDMGPITMRNIEVTGMELTFLGDMADGTVVAFFLTFEGDAFTGEWEAEGMTGFISGSKR
jgi:hypothetical protein